MSLSGIFVYDSHQTTMCQNTCLLTKGLAPKLYLKGIWQKHWKEMTRGKLRKEKKGYYTIPTFILVRGLLYACYAGVCQSLSLPVTKALRRSNEVHSKKPAEFKARGRQLQRYTSRCICCHFNSVERDTYRRLSELQSWGIRQGWWINYIFFKSLFVCLFVYIYVKICI